MPNYFTHLQFGGRVLAALPEPLRTRIEAQRADFDVGCYGPDPLFFYHLHHDNPVRQVGLRMHKVSALPVFRRLARIISEDRPGGAGYAAGFLCHFALDAGCHGYIEERAAGGQTSHLRMEGEYDRMLLELDGLDASARTHLPSAPSDWAVWEAAACAFAHASPDQMRRAYRSMTFMTGFLARANGRASGRVIGAVSHMLPIRSAKGLALKREPHPSTEESNAHLDRMIERAIPETAVQIAAFFRSIEEEGPVPGWFDRDFKGSVARPQEHLHWEGAHRHLPTT